MTNNTKLVKKDIILYPNEYFSLEKTKLEDRLNSIVLTNEEEQEIAKNHSKQFLRNKILGLTKIGEVVNEIINWNQSIDEDIKEAKKEYLLSQYFAKNDKNEESLNQLQDFLTNPEGNTLFNKILRILDDTPPDKELSTHLSNTLNHIISNDFRSLFESHKYALSQIEHLTPQALTILSNYSEYPSITLGTYSASGGKITSDWLIEFTQSYVNAKNIYDDNIINRVKNSINELINKRLIEAHLFDEKKAKCVVTHLGKEILPYINS